ncbi:MAG: hypothetical protein CR988_05680 [Treponema sp.]|nr:MAG: hypothetical protein CR988_05680 [Treponema sp.]
MSDYTSFQKFKQDKKFKFGRIGLAGAKLFCSCQTVGVSKAPLSLRLILHRIAVQNGSCADF